jgi:hypothetical protein
MERQLMPVQCMQMTFKFLFPNFHAFKYFYYFLLFTSSLPVKRGGSLSFLTIFTFAVPELLDLI